MIRVRDFVPEDAEALHAIFFRAVREGAAAAYSETQRAAWASAPDAAPAWPDRLGDQITVLAERDGQAVGFMTLGHDGHLDLAFVLPEEMGRGTAAALHDRLIAIAEDRGMIRLETEASHLARRFLLKQGWRELAEQEVTLRGVALVNFRMEKRLKPLLDPAPSETCSEPESAKGGP